MSVCLCTTCLLGTLGVQKRALDPLGLPCDCEPPCACWESSLGPLEEQPVSYQLSQFCSPLISFLPCISDLSVAVITYPQRYCLQRTSFLGWFHSLYAALLGRYLIALASLES